MKLQLDTKAKTIKIEEEVNIGELLELLEKILPGDWKNFKLLTNVEVKWDLSPTYIPVPFEPYRPLGPSRPWTQPWITYGSGDMTQSNIHPESGERFTYKQGVYNLVVTPKSYGID